jgi:hypothetical protein
LHHDVTTALANVDETMALKNGTDFPAREDAKFSQLTPRRVSQTRHHQDGSQSQLGTHTQKIIQVLREADLERSECWHPDLRCPILGKKQQTRHLRVELLLSDACSCVCLLNVVENCEVKKPGNVEFNILPRRKGHNQYGGEEVQKCGPSRQKRAESDTSDVFRVLVPFLARFSFQHNDHDQAVGAIDLLCEKPPTATGLDLFVRLAIAIPELCVSTA